MVLLAPFGGKGGAQVERHPQSPLPAPHVLSEGERLGTRVANRQEESPFEPLILLAFHILLNWLN